MAVVRHGPSNGCVHAPGCPHDIGPTQDLGVYDVDMTVARRKATADELARLTPAASAKPVRPGPAMHRLRPATGASSWRNYRSVMGAAAPAPSPSEEEPVATVTPVTPTAAIPCGTCLHERVCKHREDLEHAFERISLAVDQLTGPARISSTADCGDFLEAPATTPGVLSRLLDEDLPEPEPIRREHGGESWRTDQAPKEEPTAAERMQASRQRGGQVNRERVAEAQRYPLPRDPAERNRLVLAAVRETPDLAAAGARLGVSDTRVSQILRVIRQSGEMPVDVDDLLAERGGRHHPKAAAS